MRPLWSKTLKRPQLLVIVGVVALVAVACKPAQTGTTTGPIHFESTDSPPYGSGSINGQNGWLSTGSFDQAVSSQAASGTQPTSFGFGNQSFRLSDSVTSGTFGDQTFS